MAMCVIAVLEVAPCQCFSPGGHQTTSPGRISAFGPPSLCTHPHPDVTISLTFEPGARTAWHKHPLGQARIVAAGCGWVQSEGGPKAKIRPGAVDWCPPGGKHWHGA